MAGPWLAAGDMAVEEDMLVVVVGRTRSFPVARRQVLVLGEQTCCRKK